MNVGINFEMNIDVDNMNVNELTPLGMLMNELITNSMKYAFSDNIKGRIGIELSKKNGTYHVKYNDNGKGITDAQLENAKGSGLKIV
ncbi:MAG: histidine kinase, partial [Nitrosopumilaceae archaeon]|nr:sensor histidine kinase [Nitrosopumilaceae archaeon]NIU87487.1 histidine kinase [Nitrosopumilaceae archaeon]NIX62271.1 histidine kinase [Nitrosopumilaceae archaeon]